MIAEQHLALTAAFHSIRSSTDIQSPFETSDDLVGEVFLRCNAREVVERCASTAQDLMKTVYEPNVILPQIVLVGDVDATFPYILSHLEYIVGELLRNSIQATVERNRDKPGEHAPIEVLICETPQHVIIRISDHGGGIPRDILPHIWSFSKGSKSPARLKNLAKVPKMAATMEEITIDDGHKDGVVGKSTGTRKLSSLSAMTRRPPDLRLGMGLPMSRVYAEYWAGSLELHNLEGYGVDAFLQISKLGNKNEQLSTRASVDAV